MPLNCGAGEHAWEKEIKPVNLKGNQPWILTGRTHAEAETPLFWSSDAKSWHTGKVYGAGKAWGQEKRASEDEIAGWHHWCNGLELGQTSGYGEGQRGLACYSPWGSKESDMTEGLNWTEASFYWNACLQAKSMPWKRKVKDRRAM